MKRYHVRVRWVHCVAGGGFVISYTTQSFYWRWLARLAVAGYNLPDVHGDLCGGSVFAEIVP